jgi:hypothetical protein
MNAESASEQQLQASCIECGPPICPRAEVRVVEDVEEVGPRLKREPRRPFEKLGTV